MSGKAAGSQPAITALTATFSSVTRRQSGGITPSDRSGWAPSSIARTRSSVGGTIGSPSHHWRSQKAARTASGVSVIAIAASSKPAGFVVAGSVRPPWIEGGLRRARAGSDTPGLAVALCVASRDASWSTA